MRERERENETVSLHPCTDVSSNAAKKKSPGYKRRRCRRGGSKDLWPRGDEKWASSVYHGYIYMYKLIVVVVGLDVECVKIGREFN